MVRAFSKMVEPEWSEPAREDAEAYAEYERQVCSGCGVHPVILAHPEEHPAVFEDTYCEMCRAQAVYGRKVAARDEKFHKDHPKARPGTRRPNDGLHVKLRGMTPAEVQRRRQKSEE